MDLTTLALSSSLTLTLAILAAPLALTLRPSPLKQDWALAHVKTSVKSAFFVSLLGLFIFLNDGTETIVTTWQWINVLTFDISVSLKFDFYSIIFTPIALYVT